MRTRVEADLGNEGRILGEYGGDENGGAALALGA